MKIDNIPSGDHFVVYAKINVSITCDCNFIT